VKMVIYSCFSAKTLLSSFGDIRFARIFLLKRYSVCTSQALRLTLKYERSS